MVISCKEASTTISCPLGKSDVYVIDIVYEAD